jgi:hypothetical protein
LGLFQAGTGSKLYPEGGAWSLFVLAGVTGQGGGQGMREGKWGEMEEILTGERKKREIFLSQGFSFLGEIRV